MVLKFILRYQSVLHSWHDSGYLPWTPFMWFLSWYYLVPHHPSCTFKRSFLYWRWRVSLINLERRSAFFSLEASTFPITDAPTWCDIIVVWRTTLYNFGVPGLLKNLNRATKWSWENTPARQLARLATWSIIACIYLHGVVGRGMNYNGEQWEESRCWW